MALLVTNLNVLAAKHKQRLEIINGAVRYLGVPEDLVEKVQEYYDYLSTYSHPGPDLPLILQDLPSNLRQDILNSAFYHHIVDVDLFKGVEKEFLQELVTMLRFETYVPGDVIFRLGQVGRQMYVITKGKVCVINKEGEIVSLKVKGDYFGELAVLLPAKRSATAVSLTNVDLIVLHKFDLHQIIQDFPDSTCHFKINAVSRLQKGGILESRYFRGDNEPTSRAQANWWRAFESAKQFKDNQIAVLVQRRHLTSTEPETSLQPSSTTLQRSLRGQKGSTKKPTSSMEQHHIAKDPSDTQGRSKSPTSLGLSRGKDPEVAKVLGHVRRIHSEVYQLRDCMDVLHHKLNTLRNELLGEALPLLNNGQKQVVDDIGMERRKPALVNAQKIDAWKTLVNTVRSTQDKNRYATG